MEKPLYQEQFKSYPYFSETPGFFTVILVLPCINLCTTKTLLFSNLVLSQCCASPNPGRLKYGLVGLVHTRPPTIYYLYSLAS